MRLYRFSPITTPAGLFEAARHIHKSCHLLCRQAFGEDLPIAGNLGIFCHYDSEYEFLTNLRKELTSETGNVNQKYYPLHEPIVICAEGDIPEACYEYLYIRKADPYRHHAGDIDFYVSRERYAVLESAVKSGATVKGARIFDRKEVDMIELFDPDIDALGYVGTVQMTRKIRIKH